MPIIALLCGRYVEMDSGVPGKGELLDQGHALELRRRCSLQRRWQTKRLATASKLASDDRKVLIYALEIQESLDLARKRVTRRPVSLTPPECKQYFQAQTCQSRPEGYGIKIVGLFPAGPVSEQSSWFAIGFAGNSERSLAIE
jgi:hypothetical protein